LNKANITGRRSRVQVRKPGRISKDPLLEVDILDGNPNSLSFGLYDLLSSPLFVVIV